MKKNVASQVIGAQMLTAADATAFTGTVTVYITGNGGTQAIGSVGSGVCVHEGNGFHSYVPSQAETNYDHIAFTFIGTGAAPATVQVYTTFPQTGDSFVRIGAAGAALTDLGGMSTGMKAEVNAEADTAVSDAALATAASLATAQADLDIITGPTGVNLLTATQASIDAIEVDTNALNDTKIPSTLVFTKAGELDVNVQSINSATVVGDGNATPWDGA